MFHKTVHLLNLFELNMFEINLFEMNLFEMNLFKLNFFLNLVLDLTAIIVAALIAFHY